MKHFIKAYKPVFCTFIGFPLGYLANQFVFQSKPELYFFSVYSAIVIHTKYFEANWLNSNKIG